MREITKVTKWVHDLKKVESVNDYYILSDCSKQFFCRACLELQPLKKMSKDARYCNFCQRVVEEEYRIRAEGRGVPLMWIYKPVERLCCEQEGVSNSPREGNPVPANLKQKRGAYQKQNLPANLIRHLAGQGMSSRKISEHLKDEEGLEISYSTIRRLVSGERKQPEQLVELALI